ncbi:MAG: hypothetical protein SFY32_01445 [Bacteroidota bacterium]|nr:hypothetical protein [Bacteroidota bacterium]
MKLYSLKQNSSVSFIEDPDFIVSLNSCFATQKISTIIESGTFNGQGSTLFLIKLCEKYQWPNKFITIENNFYNFLSASKFLKIYPKVHLIWGCSVNQSKALKNLENDNFLRYHEKYPDIYIDSLDNPLDFYKNEINGALNTTKLMWKEKIIKFLYQALGFPKQNILEKCIKQHKKPNMLILLDSCGGIGILEFNTIAQLLIDVPYYLILDDINHIKHYRSYQLIMSNPKFKILNHSFENGWLIAQFTP